MLKPFTKPVPMVWVFFLGIFAVSTASPLIRMAQQKIPSIVIAAWRLGLASLILAPFTLRKGLEVYRSLSKTQLMSIVLSGFFLAIHFASWITSLEYTSVASSVVLVTTTPLWVALASPLILKEKLNRAVIIGLAIALCGGLVVGFSAAVTRGEHVEWSAIGQSFESRNMLGNFLALLGAWCSAGYMLIGRKVRGFVDLQSYTLAVYGCGAIFLVIACLASHNPLLGYPISSYPWLIALAVGPQLIGHTSFNYALRHLPAAFVSVMLLGEPIGSILLAYLFLYEKPMVLEVIGGFLILAGIYVTSRAQRGHQP